MMFWNAPNILTVLRIALIPVFIVVLYWPSIQPDGITDASRWVNLIAAIIFALAAFTDWLDGYLARQFNQTSSFGAFLDPVADKLMVSAALIVLVDLGRVGAVIALIIIGREIVISALREWMASIGKSKSVAVAMIGKLKTAAQMLAIVLLLYYENIGVLNTRKVGEVLIILAAVLTLISMVYYIRSAWPVIKDSIESAD